MKIVFFFATGTAPIPYEVQEDSLLSAINCFSGNGIVSLDPDLDVAAWGAGLSPVSDLFVLPFSQSSAAFISGLSFEIPKGQKIFVAFNGGGSSASIYLRTSADLPSFNIGSLL